MESGIALIAQERQEQIEKHNTTPQVDVQHNSTPIEYCNIYPLVAGAITLLDPTFNRMPLYWNKDRVKHMFAKTYEEKLAIAGALLAAEIDRLSLINTPTAVIDQITLKSTKTECVDFALWIGKKGYNMVSDGLWVREADEITFEFTTEELYSEYKNYINCNE